MHTYPNFRCPWKRKEISLSSQAGTVRERDEANVDRTLHLVHAILGRLCDLRQQSDPDRRAKFVLFGRYQRNVSEQSESRVLLCLGTNVSRGAG